jgi:hypothetical protein
MTGTLVKASGIALTSAALTAIGLGGDNGMIARTVSGVLPASISSGYGRFVGSFAVGVVAASVYLAFIDEIVDSYFVSKVSA